MKYTILSKVFVIIYHFLADIILISSNFVDKIANINNNIPSYERQALYDLYISTNGNDWTYKEGEDGHWNFTDPEVNPCLVSNPWRGLNCIIPTSTSNYYYISEIVLSDYNLNGYLPDSIANYSHLQYLNLSYNNIFQTIPNTIGNLSVLSKFDLSYNSLSGSLPNSIYELSALKVLNLDSNYNLQGTISNLIEKLSQLQYLNIRNNSFEGTIPSTIGNLSETLTYLRLYKNQFSGTIPNSIRNLKYLYLLYLDDNKLTGTVPDWLGELSSLSDLELGYNQLSGTIPSSLSNLKLLNTLRLGANLLTGTIPDSLGKLSLLKYLELTDNQFSNTIPSSLFDLSYLEELYLFSNMLTGSIPNLFSNLHQLIYIEINNNYLTGTLPHSISQLQNLRYLFVHNNHFTGNLDKVFSEIHQKLLRNIQLSNNQFTGKLPEQVFLSHSLTAFSAVSNCFHGSIPSSICDNSDLVSLALDGLACASSCRNKIISGISSAYVSTNEITGGMPECLLSMANLTVLHLSGNGLTGSLSDNIKLSNTLQDLSLSYNVLTGSIPSSIQERAWDNLDLSHNRISGSLRSNYASQYNNASLSLKNNRLSGSIPNHLQDMRNISILEGSYYECKYDRSDLLTHDDHRDTYECGSNVFNVLFYIWLGSVLIVCSGMFIIWYNRNHIDRYIWLSNIAKNIWKWIHILEYIQVHHEIDNNQQPIPDKYLYFKAYYNIHELVSRYSLYNALIIIGLLLPVYLILSFYYSTHTYVYAWIVSIFYLSGNIAFGIAIGVLLLFIIVQVFIFYYSSKQSTYKQALIDITKQQQLNTKGLSNQITDDEVSSQPLWKIFSMYVIYVTVNISIVGGANVAYIYAVLYQSKQIIILSQIFLSIFKMIWNNIISSKMVYWIIQYLSMHNNINRLVQQRLFMLQFIVSVLNSIIIPCFIVAIISPNCFYHAFQQESEVTSSFNYESLCVNIGKNNKCIEYETITDSTSYNPPFTYSYQCSSDFVTYYAPVFVLMGFISTFIVPMNNYIILRLSKYYYPLFRLHELSKILHLVNNNISPLIAIDAMYEFLVSILTMVGLLLTFGVVFPPLAVVFLLAIYRRIYYHKAMIGRYISYMMEHKVYSCLDIIEENCKVIPLLSTLKQCGWILLSISCIFYTLFLFDILGDKVGVAKAYWVLIVMPCIPMCIYAIYRLYKYWLNSRHRIDMKGDIMTNNNMDNNNIELTKVETLCNPLFLADMNKKDADNNVVIDEYVDLT